MKKFFKFIDRMNELIGKAISFLILILIVVIVYEIALRYFFNSPTIWAHEISQMVYGGYVILLGGYLQQRNGHVNVDILYSRFEPRTRAVINLFTWLLFFAFCGVILLKGGEMAWDSFLYRETDPTVFAPPIYPLKMLIPLGALLLLLQGLVKYIGDLKVAITGKEDTP
ncbi:MAG: tripartite AtP-independent periplasmic transporter subunit DctQ [Syntrophaceae bacterium]|nr:MAG: tripartite AtP-independent periplasmic transporter subunit DctQ [Syntrophaceae bacterium]